MASQLSKGHTFHDGDTGQSAAVLNSIVDNATLLPGAITEQPFVTPTAGAAFLYESNGLKKGTLQQIINLVPHDSPASTASLRKLGPAANQAAPGNDARFPHHQTGIRMGHGAGGTDTVALTKDIAFPSVNLHNTSIINFDLGNVFYQDLTADKTFTDYVHRNDGQEVTLMFRLNGHTVTLPSGAALATIGTGTTYWYVKLSYAVGFGMLGTITKI
jgi:hypothetical protein